MIDQSHTSRTNKFNMKKEYKMDFSRILADLVLVLPLIALLVIVSCTGGGKKKATPKAPESLVQHPAWSRNANIYEVNLRQFTPEGTFRSFGEHIPRLAGMGVDILWLMPVQPIGEVNRKGTLGSYYSVKDYTDVNPEYGTLEDLKELVARAHNEGMYVILDWVANHTAWDNDWITSHPDWYKKDSTGAIISPFDWTDVAQLDYSNKELWTAMLDAMKFWIIECDIDGYRCDVASMVPVEFWDTTRVVLDMIKPVFMLAESEDPALQYRAFDMTYAWELHHLMNSIAKGEKNANDLESYFYKEDTIFPSDAYRMLFTSNHDENSWQGTEYERMGAAAPCFAVMTVMLPGMPLIYNGQESAFNRRLAFFEKDSIDWAGYPLAKFYEGLLRLKHRNQALWNGTYGGDLNRIHSQADSAIFAFTREKEGDKIFVVANLSDKVNKANFRSKLVPGDYIDYLTGLEQKFGRKEDMRLKPWEYRIYVRKP